MIKFLLDEGVKLPQYESNGASGMDITADKILAAYTGDTKVPDEKLEKMKEGFEERGYIKLRAFERIIFGSGIKAILPEDTEIQVRARSGITAKRGLTVLNSPGTVDEDYRGEIGTILYNSTPFLNKVEKGERIAQIVPAKVHKLVCAEVSEEVFNSTSTQRGENGFGSTGTSDNI